MGIILYYICEGCTKEIKSLFFYNGQFTCHWFCFLKAYKNHKEYLEIFEKEENNEDKI